MRWMTYAPDTGVIGEDRSHPELRAAGRRGPGQLALTAMMAEGALS
ncbi:hypothetical protein GCM10010149_21690 [Nonomuraea roseoviolacea subsp. roseoviolacea]